MNPIFLRPESREFSSYAYSTSEELEKIHSHPGVRFVHQTIHSLQAVQNTISDQNGIYMGCPESIRTFGISREPVVWP
jgi:hypothetical protein